MSLSGNLGFVSLDEILRLLTRSNQQGSVDVRGEQIRGRIFITKKGVGIATTSDDDGLHRHLVKSGLVDDAFLQGVDAGETKLSSLVEESAGPIVELLREMTVESIYQLGLNGESFEVYEGKSSNYSSPKPFELEALLTDSKQRLTDWAEVSRVVDDLRAPIRFNRDLGEREDVKIDRESWRLLSEVGAGSSVTEIADELGTTQFWTARVAAQLIEEDLVAVRVAEETTVEEPAAEAVEAVGAEAKELNISEPAAADGQPDDVDPNESWWQEPEEASAESAKTEEVAVTVANASEEDSQIPTVSADGDTAEVEEDTEAFLEKVFSELDSPNESKEEGYGLLRRRRMGAARDVSNDA